MRFTFLCPLFVGTFMPVLRADDTPKDKDKPDKTPSQECLALMNEYQKAQQDAWKALREAKTEDERKKALASIPQPEQTAERLLRLAAENAKDPAALDALNWVIANVGIPIEANKLKDQAIEMIMKDQIDSPKLGNVLGSLWNLRPETAEKVLRGILDKSPHRDVQGLACFALGKHEKRMYERVTAAGKDEADKLKKDAEELFAQVLDKFGDVKRGQTTLDVLARPELFELRYLSIGMIPPDIEGEDIDGKQFKLSDYRGKVVVLDFWGNW